MAEPNQDDPASRLDLREAHRLVSALERDLEKVESGAGDVAALREEVRALAALLESPSADPAHVSRQLHTMHANRSELIEGALGSTLKGADYVSRIGRMLGM
jgi:hypothetical protein